MDQLTAHLDRGWDLAQHGDAPGAEASARQALEIDPNAPEVHNLLGYISALNGDAEEAVEHYKNALGLDEGYFDAMLNAAEVLVHPLQQFDDAVDMCDDAISWAENDEEIADAVLIKIDALLGKGDDAAARKALSGIPSGPFEGERYDFLIGRAWFELGDPERAVPHLDRVLSRDAKNAEAWYYRGLVHEAQGEPLEATSALLKVRILDDEAPPFPWGVNTSAFEQLATAAVAKLDPALRRFVEQAEVFVTPLPGLEVVADGIDPRAPLLIDGLATPERPGPPCARLFFYQRNFERSIGGAPDLPDELLGVLEAEITATFLEDRRHEAQRPRAKHELN